MFSSDGYGHAVAHPPFQAQLQRRTGTPKAPGSPNATVPVPGPASASSVAPAAFKWGGDLGSDARQTVLVIDDAQPSRELLGELLEPDHHVLLAANGDEGLTLARIHLPDLILLDVLMPVMDGYAVLRRLKADPRTADIAVIFITGLDRPEDEARSLLLGGSDFIAKPFSIPVVFARVALHLRLVRHRQQLEEMASIDGLTGIANRRRFDDTLAAECRRAERAGSAVSVAIVDVDFFKAYNDRYGHTSGDQVLRAVAQVLHNGLRRPGDLAARYGGEEFGLIMANASADHAVDVADSLCAAVRALNIPHAMSPTAPVLTVSIGVMWSVDASAGPQTLVSLADQRLYQAKNTGRNRVVGCATD